MCCCTKHIWKKKEQVHAHQMMKDMLWAKTMMIDFIGHIRELGKIPYFLLKLTFFSLIIFIRYFYRHKILWTWHHVLKGEYAIWESTLENYKQKFILYLKHTMWDGWLQNLIVKGMHGDIGIRNWKWTTGIIHQNEIIRYNTISIYE